MATDGRPFIEDQGNVLGETRVVDANSVGRNEQTRKWPHGDADAEAVGNVDGDGHRKTGACDRRLVRAAARIGKAHDAWIGCFVLAHGERRTLRIVKSDRYP